MSEYEQERRKTELDALYDPFPYSEGVDYHISSIVRLIDEGEFNLDPVWQRGRVWSDEQRSSFLGFFLTGGKTPPCWVNFGVDGCKYPADVVDGKQRISAVYDWAVGKVAARLGDGSLLYRYELPIKWFNLSLTIRCNRVRMSYVDCLKLYLRLNTTGVAHTESELDCVRKLLLEVK